MAERRMFAKTIIDSDAFLDMSVTARLLYYDLGMRADDDGFVNSPKKIMRMVGASEDDLRILVARKFIIPFDNGIVVIKHWRIHNYIQSDRYHETNYKEQKAMLSLDENKSYTLNGGVSIVDTECIQTGYQMDTQVRLGKDRIGKVIDIDTKPAKHKYGEYQNVLLSDSDMEKLQKEFPDWEKRIENLSEYMAGHVTHYKDHLAVIRSWARKDKEKTEKPKQNQFNNFEQRDYDPDALFRTINKKGQ